MPFQKGNKLWKLIRNPVLPTHRSKKLLADVSDEQLQYIVGGVLGDGSLVVEEEGQNAYFTCAGTNHGYMIKRALVLQSLCISEQPRIKLRPLPRNTIYTVSTARIKVLTDLYPLCYKNGLKMVSKEFLSLVKPLALAIWFMDDGTLVKSRTSRFGRSARYAIYTQSFGWDGNRLLVDFLLSHFGVEAKIYRDGDAPYLSIGVLASVKFRDIIEPFVVPSMYYKLDC